MPASQIVNNCLDRHARSGKHRRPAHNVWRARNNLSFDFSFHAANRSTDQRISGKQPNARINRARRHRQNGQGSHIKAMLFALPLNELLGFIC